MRTRATSPPETRRRNARPAGGPPRGAQPPIPTHTVIDNDLWGENLPATRAAESRARQLTLGLYNMLVEIARNGEEPAKSRAAEVKGRLDALAAPIPAEPTTFDPVRGGGVKDIPITADDGVETDPDDRTYRTFLAYRGMLETDERMLTRLMGASPDDQTLADALSTTRERLDAVRTEDLRLAGGQQSGVGDHVAADEAGVGQVRGVAVDHTDLFVRLQVPHDRPVRGGRGGPVAAGGARGPGSAPAGRAARGAS